MTESKPKRKAITGISEVASDSPLGTAREMVKANHGATNDAIFAAVQSKHPKAPQISKEDLADIRKEFGVVAGRGGFLYRAGPDGKVDLGQRLDASGNVMPRSAPPKAGPRKVRQPAEVQERMKRMGAVRVDAPSSANPFELANLISQLQAQMSAHGIRQVTIPVSGAIQIER